MTLQQLRYFCEIAARGWNISKTAKALYTSQPGVSRQIHALEAELGLDLFARDKSRIVGATIAGDLALQLAQRILRDMDALKQLRNQLEERGASGITVAATHTQVRYVLPKVLQRFSSSHPGIDVFLRQGMPSEVTRMVDRSDADLSISTLPPSVPDGVVMLRVSSFGRVIVTPPGHPLSRTPAPTLEQVAEYPIITYDDSSSSGSPVLTAFKRANLSPKIVVRAADNDIMKAYAAEGRGIAIISDLAFDATVDCHLCAIRSDHLFGIDAVYVGLPRFAYLRSAVKAFIAALEPGFDVETTLNTGQEVVYA